MRTETPFAIISAERAEYTPEVNAWRTASLLSQLQHRDMNPLQLCGRWAGVSEASFMIPLHAGEKGYNYSVALPQLARRWGQEAWLYVDANRYATLHYANRTEHAGLWLSTSGEEARAADGYTYDPTRGLYYVLKRAA